MDEITKILSDLKQEDPRAADRLLEVVYHDLRQIAARRMVSEHPDSTLQATALVHEAYLRLVGSSNADNWNDRAHFFAAAAEAMRRILVEAARSRNTVKRGGDLQKQAISLDSLMAPQKSDEILQIHDALCKLEAISPQAAQVVNLRYFAGFTIPETARILNISPRKTDQLWAYARTYLLAEITDSDALAAKHSE